MILASRDHGRDGVQAMTQPQAPWWRGTRGEWYLVVQGLLFALVVLGPRQFVVAPPWPEPIGTVALYAGAALMIAGALLAGSGALRLGSDLTALPYPKEGACLEQNGPYRIVRHPIYSGLIIASAGWALWLNAVMTLLYAFALFVFFDIKSRREEAWLAEKHSDYDEYRTRVKKLLPWIY